MATNEGRLIKYYKYSSGVANGSIGQVTATGATAENADIELIFDWSVRSQSIKTNTSVVDWAAKVHCLSLDEVRNGGWYDYSNYDGIEIGHSYPAWANFSVRVNNKSVFEAPQDDSWGVEILENTTATIASGTIEIQHESDGTKTVPVYVSTFYAGPSYDGNTPGYPDTEADVDPNMMYQTSYDNNLNGEMKISGESFTLNAIPRQGIVENAPDFNDEQSPTMTYVIPEVCTAAWVGIAIGGSTMTIPYRSVALSSSSYTFNFTQSEKEAMWAILARGVHTTEARFYIKTTYNGQTLEHYKVATLEVINFMPTLNPEVYDTVSDIVDRLTGNKYILVRYASKPYFNTGAQAHKGATIHSQSVKNGETTLYGPSGTFNSVTDNLFKFAATDNFGRSVTAEMEFSKPNYFVDYVKLTCSSIEVTDLTADGDVRVTIRGKYFNGSFGKRNNSMRLNYDISKNGGDFDHIDKGYIYPTMSGPDYTYTFTISGLDYMSVYTLTVRVSDEIAVEGTEVQTILASTPIFDWGRTDFNFNVPVNIEGDLTVAGNITAGGNTVPTIVAQGTAGIWTYRTWSDGTAECWGKKDVSVTFPSSANWGSLYTTGAISASNVSFPYGLFAEIPVVNASLLIRSVGGILMAPGGNDSNKATWDQTGVYEIARGAYVSGTQYYTINYDVKGRWK